MLILLLPGPGFANGLFDIGATYTITGTNFFDNFTQMVTLNLAANKSVDAGQLSLTETITADSSVAGAEWIDFYFQSIGGGSLATNDTGFWQMSITGIPLTVLGSFTGFEAYWTIDGTAAAGITAIGGLPGPIPNPINASLGSAYASVFPGGTPMTSWDLYLNASNYSAILTEGNMDPGDINGFHIGFRVTPAVATPEPASAALLGIGLAGLFGWRAVRRRRRVHR